MNKQFEVHTIKDVKIIFFPFGKDIAAINENGGFYGTFQSIENAIYYIKTGASEVICQKELSYRDIR